MTEPRARWLTWPLVILIITLTTTVHAQSAGSSGPSLDVKADGEVSYYMDNNDVSVVTPAVGFSLSDPIEEWNLSGSYLADVVTAASPDIVATASPRWTELRHGAATSGGYGPIGVHTSLSREPDYTAITAGFFGTHELDDKHITAKLGYTYGHDIGGRSGTPFSVYSLTLHRHIVQASAVFLINRETTFSLLADAFIEHGRQEKPYRYLALFSPEVAPTVERGASVEQVNALRLPGRVGEQLPDQRQRYALTGRLAHRSADFTIIAKERLYADSWSQLASSTELRAVFRPAPHWFLWPELRAHIQSPVEFWQRAYVGTVSPGVLQAPRYRTGDREHGPLTMLSLGFGSRWLLGSADPHHAWNLGLQIEGGYTRFLDTLFVTDRISGLGVLQLQKEF